MSRRIDITNRVRVVEVQNFDRKTVEIIKRGRQGATGTIAAPAIVGPATETVYSIGSGGDYPDLASAWDDLRTYVNGHFGLKFISPITGGLALRGADMSNVRLFADPTIYPKLAVSAISKTNPCVITTSSAHGLTTGQRVVMSHPGRGGNATDAHQVCGVSATITVLSSTTFSLTGVDSTSWGTYGGSGCKAIVPVPKHSSFTGVALTSDFHTTSAHGSNIFLTGVRSNLPTWDFIFDAYHATDISSAVVMLDGRFRTEYDAGIIRAGCIGLSMQNTMPNLMGSVWSLNGSCGVKIEQASGGTALQSSQFYSNMMDAVTAAVGNDESDCHCSRASIVHLQDAQFNKSQGEYALSVHRTLVNISSFGIDGAAVNGLKLLAGATVLGVGGYIANCGKWGVDSLSSGDRLSAGQLRIVNSAVAAVHITYGMQLDIVGGDISGSNGGAGPDIIMDDGAAGSRLSLYNVTTSHGSGNPDIQDIQGFTGFNTTSRLGVCYGPGSPGQTNSSNTLMIASDAITIPPSGAVRVFRVDTEASAATDNLATINGGFEDQVIILRVVSGTRKVTVKDGTGNIRTAGDVLLNVQNDTIMLMYNGNVWVQVGGSING